MRKEEDTGMGDGGAALGREEGRRVFEAGTS